MSLIICKECHAEISSDAKVCPHCGKRLKLSGCAIFVLVIISIFIIVIAISTAINLSNSNSVNPSSINGNAQSDKPKLELINHRWSIEYDYAIYEGRVKNISSESLENVEAVVTFYDRNNNFVTSSDAIIDFNPILPGQISNFKVMKTSNPEMKKAGISFKYLLGGSIEYKETK
jgi:hypothetical protein